MVTFFPVSLLASAIAPNPDAATANDETVSGAVSLDERMLAAFSAHAAASHDYQLPLARMVEAGGIDHDPLLKKQWDAANRQVQVQLLSVVTKKLLTIPETLLKS